jgi:hypothetical protein
MEAKDKTTQRKVDVIQTRVTRKTKKKIDALASERGMSPVDWMRYLIDKEIEAKDAEKLKR